MSAEVDAETDESIPGADAGFHSRMEGDGKSVSQKYVTDSDGLVQLPPIRPGTLEVQASAEGYRRAKFDFLVTAEDEGRTIEVPLQKEDEDLGLTVFLPGGKPAAGAEAALFASLQRATIIWQGLVKSDGSLAIPDVGDIAYLLIRHPQASFEVSMLPWRRPVRRINLKAAGPRLAVNMRYLDGRPVWGELFLWIEDVGEWVTGYPLQWLTNGTPAPFQDGVWIGSGLPPRPLKLAGWDRWSAHPDPSLLEANAVTTPYPWPNPLVLEVPRR